MTRDRLRLTPSAATFIAVTAGLNELLYHVPLFSFATSHLDLSSFTGGLTLATLLVDPHIYAYDLLLLLPALAVTWQWAGRQPDVPLLPRARATVPGFLARLTLPTAVRALVVAVYIAPILTIGITLIPVQWSVVSFVLLGSFLSAQVFARSRDVVVDGNRSQEVL